MGVIRYEKITNDWLSDLLYAKGINSTVRDFSVEKVGTGQLGETRRFHISYIDAKANAPKTLIGKFPSDDSVAAETGRTMGFYKAEVMFYQKLSKNAKISVPELYYAELDEENNFVLILEDMSPAKQGDHMLGCSVELAQIGLTELAKLNGKFWNDKDLEKEKWLYIPSTAQGFYTNEIVRDSWKYFVSTYGSELDQEVRTTLEKFMTKHEAWNQPRIKNRCFSHNDYRVDNMLFLNDKITVVDWQTSNYLGAGMDAAYFLGSALPRATRRSVEQDLLRIYHEALITEGVQAYSFEELVADYSHYTFAAAIVAITATVIVKKTERGDRLFKKMVSDSIYQAIDNDALDLLV